MKPAGIYVCNSKFDDSKLTIEILDSAPGILYSLELTKHEAEKLASDLKIQAAKLSDE